MTDQDKYLIDGRQMVADYRDEMLGMIILWLEKIEIQEGDTAQQFREKIVGNLRDAQEAAEKP